MSHREVLRHASLYHLTGTALSSVYTYASNPDHFQTVYTKALTGAPFLYIAFKYNIAFWAKELVEQVGNLVRYKFHTFGGHFPALDNPPALVEDIQEIAEFWQA
ncbi:Hypothetical protein NCS54_00882500 [Fusarium falciforme]|uniref:Hypothetical protein n=1 Tax=Fusarium falciforme TaxID=195108 RepID=UPI0023006E8C|nr:Hypothetical protein NCS54_00882500 [Fusarium falciforme]WAO91358.1 Hypothetical protein NCS54_00882500 [Fusarium falciforme]